MDLLERLKDLLELVVLVLTVGFLYHLTKLIASIS